MLREVSDRWWMLLVRGICAVLLGLGAIIWPNVMLLTLVILFAAFAVADGITAILLGIGGKTNNGVLWGLIGLGAVAILAGIGAAFTPLVVVLVFMYIAGFAALIRGVLEIMAAFRLRKEIEGEWMLALSGLLSIALGIVAILYPLFAANVFAIVIGINMLILGVLAIVLSLRLRSLGTRQPAGA